MYKEHFKDVLNDFCIQEGFHVIVIKVDAKKYTAKCATVNCERRIHASVLTDERIWAIKSIRSTDHGCVGVKTHNPMANSVWVAHKLIEDIMANNVVSGSSINKLLMARYGLEIKTSTIYKIKEWTLTLINGCRSLIRVDGTHLKGNYGGVLLSAIAMDGNNELFPIVVAVVDSENKDNWSFFVWHLKNVLHDNERKKWTIISDRQKPADFVSDWFSVKTYKQAYGLTILPIPDTEQWPALDVPNLEPPTFKRSIGRLSRNRRREPEEENKGKRSITIRCKKCKCLGHNSKTCKGGYTARERKEMQGNVTKKRSGQVMRMTPVSSRFKSLDELEGVIMSTIEATQEKNVASTSTSKKRKTY
ncbi:uncharacterized protein LOC141649123 [Silene latifolia]|uniref:uncharacterized protein LOC141649123 n=1 Tax=Silene latifolia TaxID=37657 RepID=UPI003D780DAF